MSKLTALSVAPKVNKVSRPGNSSKWPNSPKPKSKPAAVVKDMAMDPQHRNDQAESDRAHHDEQQGEHDHHGIGRRVPESTR